MDFIRNTQIRVCPKTKNGKITTPKAEGNKRSDLYAKLVRRNRSFDLVPTKKEP